MKINYGASGMSKCKPERVKNPSRKCIFILNRTVKSVAIYTADFLAAYLNISSIKLQAEPRYQSINDILMFILEIVYDSGEGKLAF